ncbi:hypothetical protein J2R98_000160 [Alkalibacillus filiformis]|uniref:Restriction endonuclease type II DpnII-like domain-containing protein n=1 Tax=Alkalibacillus filiformis TaxID=200990 RepID=A0ABU0DPI1_9BACI|nr:DpnII family type II restriction endonuclease [Alkalibacillus filiformis]MDQ0350357.1 hypothetical protein [Alkalibacillus filiformis]
MEQEETIQKSADEIHESLRDCLPMDELYFEFIKFREEILKKIDNFEERETLLESLKAFLSLRLKSKEYPNFFKKKLKTEYYGFKVLVNLIGLSGEQCKNIIFNHSTLDVNFSESKVANNEDINTAFADLLMNGYEDAELKELVDGDQILLECFNLKKINGLVDLLDNSELLNNAIRMAYKGRLSGKKGYHTEQQIIGELIINMGYTYESGIIDFLIDYYNPTQHDQDRNPKVDLIIPDKQNPKILIESSYQLSTGSSQTRKGDSYTAINNAVKKYNDENDENLIFINFVDGAGWKQRGKVQINRLMDNADYVVNYDNLDNLINIVKHYMD